MGFASGKFSIAYCDRCGFRFKYSELKEETENDRPSGRFVCEACFDIEHPQDDLHKLRIVDNEALEHPRPDLGGDEGLFSWNPVADFDMTMALSGVFVQE